MDEKYLTVTEFADKMQVTRSSVYNWLRDGHPEWGHLLVRRPRGEYEIAESEVVRLNQPITRRA